jgi:hypothetical protein
LIGYGLHGIHYCGQLHYGIFIFVRFGGVESSLRLFTGTIKGVALSDSRGTGAKHESGDKQEIFHILFFDKDNRYYVLKHNCFST